MKRLGMRLPGVLLHLSLLLVAAGGVATWLTAERRTVTLTPGVAADAGLPAQIVLDSLVTVTYPGTDMPRDFRSYIRIGDNRATVSVNAPAEAFGYVLRQESCDNRGRSTIEVARDPLGIPLVYTGFLLFLIGGVGLLIDPRGRFRRLVGAAMVTLLTAAAAQGAPVAGISADQARQMRARQVLWNGRVAPMNTAATEICRKLCGSVRPGGAAPEQVVASMILYPEEWRSQHIIKVESRRLADSLGITGGYAALNDLFDTLGNYRLRPLYGIDPELDKAVLDLDEKMEIITLLQQGRLIRPVPEGMAELSRARVELELIYNAVPFAQVFFPAAILLGLAAFFIRKRGAVAAVGWVLTAWQAAGWTLRWIISGSIPLGNGGETLLFLSIALMAVSLLTLRRPAAGILAAGFAGLTAWLSMRNPAITPLMPVLHSPWLAIHVTLVMLSYALLALTFVIALTALARPAEAAALRRKSMTLLYPATVLLGAGIITGAMWAQTSWGRYWSWDPKETWALITLLIYALPFHRAGGLLSTPRRFHIYMALALLSVAMTYWGVNFTASLHAYQ